MASTSTQRRCPVVLLPIAIVWIMTGGWTGCVEEHWGETHATGTRINADRPECPQQWDSVPLFRDTTKIDRTRGRVVGTTTIAMASGYSALAAAGPQTDIPEFNDCQKFITRASDAGSAHYEALYAVFAAYKLDSIIRALPLDTVVWSSSNPSVAAVDSVGRVTAVAAGTASIIATSAHAPTRKVALAVVVRIAGDAMIHPELSVTTYTPPESLLVGETVKLTAALSAPTTSTLPVAEIYTYGPGDPILGIGPNFSCLYLYFDAAGHLAAKMIPVPDLGTSAAACFGAADPNTAPGQALSVLRTTGFGPKDYPAVARWDWDPVNQHQYVGIMCGNGWCEIGRQLEHPFTPSRRYGTAELAGRPPKVVGVKGWYDEQYLAVPGGPGQMVPSSARGTVIPDSDLAKRDSAAFVGRWVRVAHIAIDTVGATAGAAEYYKHKFNFDPVGVNTSLTGMNTLSLCYGTRDDCRVPKPPSGKGCGPDTKPPFVWRIRRWWSRVDAAEGGRPMYRCVTRRAHDKGIDIPATTRWRWLALDETTWDWCPLQGCCESNGDAVSAGW